MAETKAPGQKGKKPQAEEIDKLMEYLKQGGSLGLEIQKRLEGLPPKYVVLFITRQEKYDLLISNLVKNFTKKGMQGVFVTLNKGTNDLLKLLQKNKVDCKGLYLIDAISKAKSKAAPGTVSYIDSPQNLTEIEAEITDLAEKLPKERFLILDSLSTLLIYNAEKTVEKFVRILSEKLRTLGFQAVFTIMDQTKPEVRNVLAQFCDKVIKPSPQIKP